MLTGGRVWACRRLRRKAGVSTMYVARAKDQHLELERKPSNFTARHHPTCPSHRCTRSLHVLVPAPRQVDRPTGGRIMKPNTPATTSVQGTANMQHETADSRSVTRPLGIPRCAVSAVVDLAELPSSQAATGRNTAMAGRRRSTCGPPVWVAGDSSLNLAPRCHSGSRPASSLGAHLRKYDSWKLGEAS